MSVEELCRDKANNKTDTHIMSSVAHLKIPLENILTATNNFAKENFWGEADFGTHYKGELLWSGELIDIVVQRWNKEWDDEKEQL
ncbi:hypothetical protein Tco_1120989 [Tanacetum coccineum]|uniref:Uncharacterized protein n=1 Tax=Tanacetum coccineum TaxID=301880 RepID=A0ABQ5J027_9ASTR